MKTIFKALSFALISLPLLASAGNKTATSAMEVSFVVKESCNVSSTANSNAKSPAVACQLNTPYQLSRSTDQAATGATAPVRTQNDAQNWTVYF